MAKKKATKKAAARKPRSKSATKPPKKKGTVDEEELGGLRSQIDALDAKIVPLINERAEIAGKIGRIKARDGAKAFAPSREREVYERVAELNKGPLPSTAFQAIYREVMSATIALERSTRVCYFGKPGSFTHLAARSKFGTSVEYVSAQDIRDVFMAVTRSRADYGLIPIENSTEGGVNQSLDLLAETRLKVCGEVFLAIHQHLLSFSPVKQIKKLYSHPQAFAQCRNWLTGHLGDIERKEVSSTAEAAARCTKEKDAGAVAGRLASEFYSLPIQVENIEDQQDNVTRFFIIAEESSQPSGHDKTSLLVSVGDEPGALLRILEPFQDHQINLTRIESRPSKRRAWEYNFFIDVQGHVTDPLVKHTLKEVARKSRHLEVLGSYPATQRSPAHDNMSASLEGTSS